MRFIASRHTHACEQITDGDPPAALAQAAVKKNVSDFFMMIFLGRFVFTKYVLGLKNQVCIMVE